MNLGGQYEITTAKDEGLRRTSQLLNTRRQIVNRHRTVVAPGRRERLTP
jgi:hypothetical protein